ncbi:hypothetical protein ACHAXR_005156 [Thalassiosira sp. AJA248-18]
MAVIGRRQVPSAWLQLLVSRGKHSQSKSKRKGGQSSTKWLERQKKDEYVKKAQKMGLPSRAFFKLQEINENHAPALLLKNEKGKENKRKKLQLIRPGMLVLDLGAAPGGWSLYASSQLKPDLGGAVVAVDLLPLDQSLQSNNTDIFSRIRSNIQHNFQFIQGDFTNNHTHMQIMEAIDLISNTTEGGSSEAKIRRPDLIISDMAPNFTGDSLTDALRTLNLGEQALAFAAGNDCFDPSYSAKDNQGMLATGGAFICKYFLCGQNEKDLIEATKRVFSSVHSIKPKASRKESSEMYLLALDLKRG